MKKASIISIGTEIMHGKMHDTNSTFLCRWLADFGIQILYRINTADNIDQIINACKFASDSDILIFTGGLGPTDDDITREATARYLQKKLVFNQSSWQHIRGFFKNRKRPMAESNKKQAFIIENSIPLLNERGTAPGIFYHDGSKTLILLPGPPQENQPMILDKVYPLMKKKHLLTGNLFKKIFKVYKIGESRIADLFKNVTVNNIEVGYYFSQEGFIELHFSCYTHNSYNQEKIDDEIGKFLSLLDKNNILYTENKELSQLVLEKLQASGKTISFAESITGGSLSAYLVRIPGASDSLNSSFVTYSNRMKQQVLGVSEITLSEYGAVSEETAIEMAKGLRQKTNDDICVAITGIAGPTGHSPGKPLGLVYFSFYYNDKVVTKKEIFSGSRERIIKKCIMYTYAELYRLLH